LRCSCLRHSNRFFSVETWNRRWPTNDGGVSVRVRQSLPDHDTCIDPVRPPRQSYDSRSDGLLGRELASETSIKRQGSAALLPFLKLPLFPDFILGRKGARAYGSKPSHHIPALPRPSFPRDNKRPPGFFSNLLNRRFSLNSSWRTLFKGCASRALVS